MPWSVHVIKVDRSNPEFQLDSMLGRGNTLGLGTVTEQARQWPTSAGRLVAAVNGDFYERDGPYEGDPKGLQISRGELISAPVDWTCMWVDASGTPQMGKVASRFAVTWPNGESLPLGLNERRPPNGAVLYTRAVGSSTRALGGRELVLEKLPGSEWLPLKVGQEYKARVREIRDAGDSPVGHDAMVVSVGPQWVRSMPKLEIGAVLTVSTATTPDLKGASMAISGGPTLVHAGKEVPNSSRLRHPRTAVGWNKQFIFLVEVDGRQPTLSIGMNYGEMASYFLKLGCEEAMNLDGGGSSTIWVRGHVVNNPCEGGERGVGNSLVVVHRPKPETQPTTANAAPKTENGTGQ